MKKALIAILLLVSIISLTSFWDFSNTTLRIKITNIVDLTGTIHLNVYEESGFPEKGRYIHQEKICVKSEKEELSFQIPNGDYAIALYHDVNDNNELDKNFFGYPMEPYGFSQNYQPTFSKPCFADCEFSLNGGEKVMTIALIH